MSGIVGDEDFGRFVAPALAATAFVAEVIATEVSAGSSARTLTVRQPSAAEAEPPVIAVRATSEITGAMSGDATTSRVRCPRGHGEGSLRSVASAAAPMVAVAVAAASTPIVALRTRDRRDGASWALLSGDAGGMPPEVLMQHAPADATCGDRDRCARSSSLRRLPDAGGGKWSCWIGVQTDTADTTAGALCSGDLVGPSAARRSYQRLLRGAPSSADESRSRVRVASSLAMSHRAITVRP